MALNLAQWLQLLASALAFTLAAILLRVGGRSPAARPLFGLLLIEGVGQLLWCLQRGAQYADSPWTPHITIVAMVSFSVQTVAYLTLIRLLPSPLVAPLRGRASLPIAAVLIVGPVLANSVLYFLSGDTGNIANEAFRRGEYFGFAVAQLSIFVVGFYSLAAALSAYRRSPRGSSGRKQARAFAVAFAVRDLAFSLALVLTFLADSRAPGRLPEVDPVWPLATLLYVPLIAYGILQTQLFDIDLKIKAGISRSTVAAVGIAVVLIAAKVFESYVSRELGFIAGGVAAGMVLFLAPRLNKLGDKVANTALPNVQATSTYVAFKKMEVYRAAVEAAIEDDGVIDAKERVMLGRLRAKLDLTVEDCSAVELEVTKGAPSHTATSGG